MAGLDVGSAADGQDVKRPRKRGRFDEIRAETRGEGPRSQRKARRRRGFNITSRRSEKWAARGRAAHSNNQYFGHHGLTQKAGEIIQAVGAPV